MKCKQCDQYRPFIDKKEKICLNCAFDNFIEAIYKAIHVKEVVEWLNNKLNKVFK